MKKISGLLAVAAMAAVSAFGTPTCSTTSGSNNFIAGAPNSITAPPNTSDTYVPCAVGSSVFQNVSYDLNTGSFTGSPDVAVTAVNTTGDVDSIEFNPNLSYVSGVSSDLELEFQVVGPVDTVSLAFNGTGTGFVNEVVCTTFMSQGVCGANGNTGTLLATLNVTSGFQTDAASLGSTQSEVWIYKDINGGNAPFSELSQSYSAPEPMTLSLMGAGLLGLGILGRRRVRK